MACVEAHRGAILILLYVYEWPVVQAYGLGNGLEGMPLLLLLGRDGPQGQQPAKGARAGTPLTSLLGRGLRAMGRRRM